MAKDNFKQIKIIYSSWDLTKDIWELLKPYRGRFWLATFCRLIGDLAWLYPAFAFASIVTFLTKYQSGESLDSVWIILAWFVAAIIVRCLSQYISKFWGYKIGERLSIDSSLKTMNHMFLLDMAWHEKENSGNKIKRINNAGDGINKIIRFWFNSIVEIVVNLIAINIIMWQFDGTVVWLVMIFLLTYFVISTIMTSKAGKASYRVNAQEEEVNGLLFESINNIRTVKVMDMAKTLYSTLVTETEDLFGKVGKRIFWYQSRNSFLSFWQAIWKIGINVVIILGISKGYYEIGFLILFSSYFSDLRESIDELSNAGVEFVTAKYSVARMKDILNEPITIDNEVGKTVFPKEWKKISIKDVSFSYGDNQVLSGVSFDVNRGEKLGIVGLSGAGKSTLFKLLLKEREEFSGDILFDDVSIKEIRKRDYFDQVSVVLQDTEVFNFSLKDNITITNANKRNDSKVLKRSLNTAHLDEVVDKLPNGLETIIGEKGVKLSGGERQRLGIARAVFKEPELLLLDEATSHLDLESEEKIQASLHDFFENVTAIVIAHRLTTIKEMDKILVIEDGKIIESGDFEELQAKKGRFYELWEKQKL